MEQNLYLDLIDTLIKNRISIFKETNSITRRNSLLPTNQDYPLKDNHWYKIDNVISIFVDIRWSTNLSANNHDHWTASIYELFTWTAIRIFHEMWAEYIDIKWDWVFALFSKNKIYTALASAITFKTFAKNTFKTLVDKKLNWKVDIWFHMWMDQKTVLVKQLWIKNNENRWDIRKNEVWAWKPINMSAKLASLSKDWELYVSDRFFKNLWNNELIIKSCGCSGWMEKWEKIDLWELGPDLSNDNKFDFNKAYVLKNIWCSKHWKEWCKKIIALDNN